MATQPACPAYYTGPRCEQSLGSALGDGCYQPFRIVYAVMAACAGVFAFFRCYRLWSPSPRMRFTAITIGYCAVTLVIRAIDPANLYNRLDRAFYQFLTNSSVITNILVQHLILSLCLSSFTVVLPVTIHSCGCS